MRLKKCALFWNILAVLPQEDLGRDTDDPFERTGEMALISKTKLSSNVRERISPQKQVLGLLDTPSDNVLVGREADALFKQACKMIGTHANQTC